MRAREIVFCILVGGFPMLIGGLGTLHDHRCLYGNPGCGKNYSCSSGSGACPDQGTWQSKNGAMLMYNICVSKAGFDCELVNVPCHHERRYRDTGCGDICELEPTTTPGCN